jgi:hypothetical protein
LLAVVLQGRERRSRQEKVLEVGTVVRNCIICLENMLFVAWDDELINAFINGFIQLDIYLNIFFYAFIILQHCVYF